ncbi:ESX secretion-associated protein EspG [Actinosynnema sp. NPDC050436]|uniref:ESX secretion-associated protein EspG n=1 Tax=Actinosynnema sp. NPDC050436 TaxID=3155659 RepID=UPI0033D48B06
MTSVGTVVLSTLEFDVAWEAERHPRRNVALDVPSPGTTHTERGAFVERAWESLAGRGLAAGRRLTPELADTFALLANPQLSVDLWIWVDRRKIKGVAAASGGDEAVLAVVDGDEVWLIEARASALAEAAVSVTGEVPAGHGRSISLPNDVLHAASDEAGRDAEKLVLALERQGLPLHEAQELAGMCDGMSTRGQFGAERSRPGAPPVRADRVVSWHDTPSGRYLHLVRPSSDGRNWSTITPIDNARLAACVWELVHEV